MPDLIEDARGRVVRSRRRFFLILSLALASLLIGVAAFAFSLAVNWQNTRTAVNRANRAAALATTAALHAEEAHQIADQARADTCQFLATVQDKKIDERATARKLYLEFRCAELR